MFYYNLFKQGHLPDAGSISEQSFRAMNLFGFIGAYVEECQEKKQEDENARRRSGG